MKRRWCALGAACLLFFDLPAAKAAPRAIPSPKPLRLRASDLYGPGLRRSAQTYLRLKLLELREADLDRARLVIERKLGIDALLGTPAPLHKDAGSETNRRQGCY
jgi:hypothetical protein